MPFIPSPSHGRFRQTWRRASTAAREESQQAKLPQRHLPRLFADLSRERSPFTIFAEIRLGRDGSTDPGLNNLLGEFAHLFVSGAKRLDSGFVLFSQKTAQHLVVVDDGFGDPPGIGKIEGGRKIVTADKPNLADKRRSSAYRSGNSAARERRVKSPRARSCRSPSRPPDGGAPP